MSGDDFTRTKFAWLDQVANDPEVSAIAFKLAYRIATHLNRKTRVAWPSQVALAAGCGLVDRSVRRLLVALQVRGHLSIKPGGGRGHASEYRLIVQGNPDASVRFSPRKGGHPATERWTSGVNKGGHPCPTNPLIEPFEEPFEGRARAKAQISPNGRDTKRGTRLPSDWQPTSDDWNYAAGKGLDAEVIEREAERFRNYWTARAGKGAAKRDWAATWRNWILKAAEDRERRPNSHGGGHNRALRDLQSRMKQ